MNVTLKSTSIVLLLSLLGSCSKSAAPLTTFHMGEKVTVGSLIYTVLSADWKSNLGDGKTVAKDRFLVIHLSVTNSGGAAIGSPLAELIDAQGKESGELQDAKNLPQWLGLMRSVSPAATETGTIAFDVPLGIYKLKVSDGNIENEKSALIEIPLELNTQPQAPAVGLPGQK